MGTDQRVILLDLNYTFVANSHFGNMIPLCGLPLPDGTRMPWEEAQRAGLKAISEERYRDWLVPLLRDHTVVMITARKAAFLKATLDRIAATCGLKIDLAYFKPDTSPLPVDVFKPFIVRKYLWPAFGQNPDRYFALESNAKTRAAYAAMGIRSAKVPTDRTWTSLPFEGEQPVQSVLFA